MRSDARLKDTGRGMERLFLLLLTLCFSLYLFRLFNVQQNDFTEVNKRLTAGTIMNINDQQPGKKLAVVLERQHYFSDPADIAFASGIVDKVRSQHTETIDNIGELNKRLFEVPVELAFSKGGESYKRRARIERQLAGFSDADSSLVFSEKQKPMPVGAQTSLNMGSGTISVLVEDDAKQPVSGVLVRLTMVLPPDSLYSDKVEEVLQYKHKWRNGVRSVYAMDSTGNQQLQSLSAFARTGIDGTVTFVSLPEQRSFSVLPLRPGYEYGGSQGIQITGGTARFSFRQWPHTMKLFANRDFSALKKERSLIVRTPDEAVRWFLLVSLMFVCAFWLLHIFISWKMPNTDQFILPCVMLLTGLSFITLLSLQDPLRDRFLARSTSGYFLAGIVAMVIMMLFNLRYLTVDSAFYRMFVLGGARKAAHGVQWAIAAIGLLALTIMFGTGPEGSGVKVNLFGFQPSEIVKYLILLFLAGFFSLNEKFIAEYTTWNRRFYFFALALGAIVASILMFLVLGDLGPAMVVCFTFIILFSFSRGDFAIMIGSVILYVLSLWLLDNVWLGTAVAFLSSGILMWWRRRQLSESSLMALVLIAGFLLIDQVPLLYKAFPGPVQRLSDRKAIWQDAWNNEVFGGDQVANGIWAMAGGGITGQGVGQGFAKTIPEAHTDMILPSIGEELGCAGILCIFIVFLLYLQRAINIGRLTGTPFLFYLAAGIGISTFIQFLLIAGGSTGALPLSGVALPFISYGGSSLIANMIAAGFLLSASHISGTPAQMKFISRQQDKNLVPALVAAVAGIVLLAVNVSRYVLSNDKWVVEPALVADRNGARMFSYNPRINILMGRLQAGNLLDRNGKILATSHPGMLETQADSLVALGIPRNKIEQLAFQRQDRYYPFAEQTFFWTGDANTGIFNGSPNGYFAEYEHAAELRGFPTPSTRLQVSASRYRSHKYLPRQMAEMTVSRRDYSALAPLLLAGINSPEVEAFKNRNRDVQLTVDAALQTSLNMALATDDSVKIKRVSVVIMEDNTGDVLASSSYPLPQINNWDLITLSDNELNHLPGWNVNRDLGFTYATQPGSTAKLVTALAAFNKLGERAATLTKRVLPQDLIRVKGPEPDEAGNISIERAIVRSNNSFFIRLANEEQLQEEMGTLYMKSGMYLRGVGGYYYSYDDDATQQDKWRDLWRKTEFASLRYYNPGNIKRTRGKGISGMSWGQGELIATPASVARIAAGIANNGKLMQTRLLMGVSGRPVPVAEGISLTNVAAAGHMKTYMLEQSAGKIHRLHLSVAGKTGTPERIWKGERINDGWYVFFVPKANGNGHIVTCVRLEAAKGSSEAVRLAGTYIIPVLLQRGYIKGFENSAIKTVNEVNSAAPAADVPGTEDTAVPEAPVDSVP